MTEARAFFIARLRRSLSVVIAREMARHRLRRIPFIGVPRAAVRARQPFRAPQEARHMPQMAQLADFMRFQAYGAAPAAVGAPKRASVGLYGCVISVEVVAVAGL